MKRLVSLAMIASLCLIAAPGCSKKKSCSSTNSSCSTGSCSVASNNVPAGRDSEEIELTDTATYDYVDDKDLFEDTDVNELAFVDDETASEFDALSRDADQEAEMSLVWGDEADQAEEVSFKTVYFDFDKANIRKDQAPVLAADIEAARRAVEEGKMITVQGHTDQIGSPSYNMGLSERRAQEVKQQMVEAGIPADYVEVVGFGQEMPLVWTDKTDRLEKIHELAANRRVEIVATDLEMDMEA